MLAGVRHIGRMTSVLVPTAASEPRLPPRPPLARAARTRRRSSRGESVARSLGGFPDRRPALPLVHAWALLALMPLGSTAAHAEPAARMGATSRATIQISLSVAPRLEVSRSGVTAAESGGGAGTESFCVQSNSAVGSYSITASEPSDGSASEPVGKGFPFEVQLTDEGAGMPLSLAPGMSLTGLTAASEGCRSGRLVIRGAKIASGDPAIDRSDALLLLIAPD